MIILEGTPGAGKTTFLGARITTWPDTCMVFPEAQPRSNLVGDLEIAPDLLLEDSTRLLLAHQLAMTKPGIHVYSDRCYIGVLAYRKALVQLGFLSLSALRRVEGLVEDLNLPRGHALDHLYVCVVAPQISLRRRIASHSYRYSIWFEPDFLTAYNESLGGLVEASGIPVTWIDASRMGMGPRRLRKLSHHVDSCCGDARSPCAERADGSTMQLFANTLHVQQTDAFYCCNRAVDVVRALRLDLHAGVSPIPQPEE
jgi:hypothetical protein